MRACVPVCVCLGVEGVRKCVRMYVSVFWSMCERAYACVYVCVSACECILPHTHSCTCTIAMLIS